MENNNENANTETVCDVAQDALFNRNVVAERGMDTKGSSNTDRTSNLLANPATNKAASSQTGRSKETEHVIYGLIDPHTNLVMYVGYTSNLKARFSHHCSSSKHRSNAREIWVNDLLTQGTKPICSILERTDEQRWEASERHWINHYKLKNPTLTNHAMGGAGGIKGRKTLLSDNECKGHITLRISAQVYDAIECYAKESGQTISWVIDNTLAVAFGLRDWPKPPKGMKKAKEIAKK